MMLLSRPGHRSPMGLLLLLKPSPIQTLLGQTVLCACALGLLALLREDLLGLSLAGMGNVGITCVLLVLVMVIRVTENKIWSVPSIYLIVFCLFHFGLTSVYGLGMLSDAAIDGPGHISYWIFRDSTKQAAYLSCLGLMACGVGIHLGLLRRRSSAGRARRAASRGINDSTENDIGSVGSALVILSVATWFAVVIVAGGPGLLISSYKEYLAATAPYGAVVTFVWLGMGMGLSFLAIPALSRRGYVAFGAFGLFGLFALFGLLLGLRGEILFITLPAVVIAGKRRKPPSMLLTIGLGLGLLVVIATVRNLRQLGVASSAPTEVAGNPLDALVEMGSSLRPVSEVVLWHESGDEFLNGQSYWAPIDRALARLLPVWPAVPTAEDDPRILNMVVQDRVGPIGFSPVAEAYYNLGDTGVVGVMFAIGVLLGRIEGRPSTPVGLAITGVILVELLINTRNDFVPVLSHIAAGMLLVYAVSWLSALRQSGRGSMA